MQWNENLRVLPAEVRSKLQDNVVVSVKGGMVVDRSLRNTQVADVVNKVFKYLICHALMTSPISVATCCKQVLGCGTCVESWLVNHDSCLLCRSDEIATIQLTSFSELLEKVRQLYDLWNWNCFEECRTFIYSPSHQLQTVYSHSVPVLWDNERNSVIRTCSATNFLVFILQV